MEVEYVSAEALKSICLWTDGLINRQWLEKIGTSGCFSRKALRHRGLKRTCKDNTLTNGVKTNPLLDQYLSATTLCVIAHPKSADLFDLVKRANEEISQSSCPDGIWCGSVSFPLPSLPPLFLLAWCSFVAVVTPPLLRETTTLPPHAHTHVVCCTAHTPGGCILLNVMPWNWSGCHFWSTAGQEIQYLFLLSYLFDPKVFFFMAQWDEVNTVWLFSVAQCG